MQKQSSVEPFQPANLVRRANPVLTATVSRERRRRVVHLAGELDIAAREVARDACVVGDDHHVIVDLSAVTFMDSRGYSALVAARESLERRGVSMTLRNLTGQPARLVGLLSVVDSQTNGSATDSGWKSSSVASARLLPQGFIARSAG